jgi:type 1 fimbria pilin
MRLEKKGISFMARKVFIRLPDTAKIARFAASLAGAMRVAPVVMLTVAAVGVAVSPSAKASDVYAFGQQISLPRNTGSGTVLARYYITPMEACGYATCTVASLTNYPNGANSGVGPTITTNVSGVSTRVLVNGQGYQSAIPLPTPVTFTQPLEVQLMSDGRPNMGGALAGSTTLDPYYIRLDFQQSKNGFLKIYLKGTITPINGTCSVPNQTVMLPRVLSRDFSGVGSSTGVKSFQIQINDCPQGYNKVGYMFTPVGGTIAGSPGVLPLAAGSTANGVQIRVANDRGEAATFGTSIRLDAYSKATGGSYSIPIQVSYVQTGATLKPGTVNGSMIVLLNYE